MRIAITGAAGWLGRYVTEALSVDHDLVLVDNVDPREATIFDPDSPSGRRVEPLVAHWPYHRLDILDEARMAEVLDGTEVVIHLAAWPTGDWDRARSTMQTNVMGTFNVFETARSLGIRRVVSASSINAFGSFFWRVSGVAPARFRLPLAEDEPIVTEDPYSLSKATTELIGQTFNRAFGLESVSLRFAGVWPEQRYDHVLEQGLPPATGWADDLYQWVHVRDVTQGIVLAASAPQVLPLPITLGAADTAAPQPTMTLLETFRPELIPYLREPVRGRDALLSIARATAFLGYHPQFSLAEAIRP